MEVVFSRNTFLLLSSDTCYFAASECSTPHLNDQICFHSIFIVQELCESRGGRPELSVLTSLLVSVDVKIY